MRWITENENNLWRTIFQIQSLAVDLDKVSPWPDNRKLSLKAIKKKTRKYRRTGTRNVTFRMGSKDANATVTPTPRKARTSDKAAATAVQSDLDATESPTVISTPAVIGTGRGRGRPRKTPAPAPAPAPASANTNTLTAEPPEPVSKRTRTERTSSGTTIEVQIPVSPGPARTKSNSDKEDIGPSHGFVLKNKDVQKKGPTSTTAHEGKKNKRAVPKRNARKIKVENTEAYARCGEVVDCKGACCGEPRCVYCFGEWEGCDI